jgi:preprotein translocase subunit SecA
VSLEDDLMRLFGSERIASLMDKMGHKEGEVLQHSMISRSIERAQKKVEENNFGTRKRLLEYDDVMNAQRKGIYDRRNHALYGERLSIDIDNAIFHVCEDLALNFEGNRDHEAFKFMAMQQLAVEPQISAEDFAKAALPTVAEGLYNEAKEMYARKFDAMREAMLPQLREIMQQQGGRVENIAIPFTDGVRGIQILVPMQEAIDNEARPVQQALEKGMTLALIDEAWKDHLRAMDDLRHSVQTATYEQKDPLLIYKLEAFKLFDQMRSEVDRNIVSFLLRAGIPMEEAPHEATAKDLPMPAGAGYDDYYTNAEQVDAAGDAYGADESDYYHEPAAPQTAVKRAPVQAGPKIGRNDPCPCGSGKKYKQCHGKGIA